MNRPQNKKNTQETASAQTDSRQQTDYGSWMNHPNLSGMDISKPAMLGALAEQGSKKSPQELLPFLMSIASQNQSKGIRFSNEEIDTIIQVLKAGKSPAEVQRMEQMIRMLKMLR